MGGGTGSVLEVLVQVWVLGCTVVGCVLELVLDTGGTVDHVLHV